MPETVPGSPEILQELESKLGWTFRDPDLLRLALTHPSVVNDRRATVQDNQRLEFLGDAVLQLVLTHELFDRFPRQEEGPMTKVRAGLVNRRFLAVLAKRLGVGQHLIMSRGESTNGGRERPSALADAFEALLGALYLDAGIDRVRRFVLRLYAPELADLDDLPGIFNPKGELQELLQTESAESASYRAKRTSGPDHKPEFECTVYYRGEELGSGRGTSKKDAESEAALAALKKLRDKAPPG